jgi:hypothetical protein
VCLRAGAGADAEQDGDDDSHGGEDDGEDESQASSNNSENEEDILLSDQYASEARSTWAPDGELVVLLSMLVHSKGAELMPLREDLEVLIKLIRTQMMLQRAMLRAQVAEHRQAALEKARDLVKGANRLVKDAQEALPGFQWYRAFSLKGAVAAVTTVSKMKRSKQVVVPAEEPAAGKADAPTRNNDGNGADQAVPTDALRDLRSLAIALLNTQQACMRLAVKVVDALQLGSKDTSGSSPFSDHISAAGLELDEAMKLTANFVTEKGEDEVKKFVGVMISDFMKHYGDSFGKIKAALLKAAKKHVEKEFDDGYGKMRRYTFFRLMFAVVVHLDYFELTKHIDEIEQVTDLVRQLFELTVNAENLDEVSDRWMLLYDETGKLKCKGAYRVLKRLLWDDTDVRRSLKMSQIVAQCQAPYQMEVVRLFKTKAANHLRKNYAEIIRELNQTESSIRYLQSKQQQAVGYTLSLFVALWIGIFNFLSKVVWQLTSPTIFNSAVSTTTARGLSEAYSSGGATFTIDEISTADAAATASGALLFDMLQVMQQQLSASQAAADKQLAASQAAADKQLSASQAAADEQKTLLLQQLALAHKQLQSVNSVESAVVPACERDEAKHRQLGRDTGT